MIYKNNNGEILNEDEVNELSPDEIVELGVLIYDESYM